jgi:hypothetical protein
MSDEEIYNPLDIDNLAQSVGLALEARPLMNLVEVTPFNGVGLYALYYAGDHAAYRPIVEYNKDSYRIPLYVGRAVSSGTRKGAGFGANPNSRELFNRLKDHRGSIESVKNLRAEDFFVRYLKTMAVWVPLGEASLIERYRPVWNVVVDGFGNHDPGGGRRRGERPKWDVIHPGRGWAELQAPNRVAEEAIILQIRGHLFGIVDKPQPPTASTKPLDATSEKAAAEP